MVAILGDREGSRDVPGGAAALREWTDRLNGRHGQTLDIGFSLSRGDEIQALARNPVDAWRVVEECGLGPDALRMRFSLGVGRIATPPAESTWDMDGPCFHRAREAMPTAKREKRWVAVRGFGEPWDGIVDGVIRSLQVLRGQWTPRQREAVVARRSARLQQDAAVALGVKQATLSKLLKAAHYASYTEAEHALRELLDLAWSQRKEFSDA